MSRKLWHGSGIWSGVPDFTLSKHVRIKRWQRRATLPLNMKGSTFPALHRLRLFTFAMLVFPMTLCSYGQGTRAISSIGETYIDTPIGISIEDLQSALNILNDLRREKETFCPKEKLGKPQNPDQFPGEFCNWHHTVPQELRKEVPKARYDQIAGTFSPPYAPYDLNRLQDGLELLVCSSRQRKR
jgi:hypothetical protein